MSDERVRCMRCVRCGARVRVRRRAIAAGEEKTPMWSARTYCGLLGWLVVLQSVWLNPFVTAVDAKERVCMLTQRDVSDIACVVEADDGWLYDAMELRRWLSYCWRQRRPLCVIPTKPITAVRAVRLVATKPAAPPPAPPPRPRGVSVGTQTSPIRKRRVLPPRVQIPSARSAFQPFRRD